MVIIVGGGWAGCAAAFAAKKAGAEVTLIEKTDMLLGTGLVGGIMRNNGRFTAIEECWAMGGGEFLGLIERVARHHNLDFPGHRHATLYDVTKIEAVIRNALQKLGVKLLFKTRITGVIKKDNLIIEVITESGKKIAGGVFIDATGSAGPAANCTKLGNGCAMCILRCPTFGPRVSLSTLAGVEEKKAGRNFPGFEAMSGSCKIDKNSLSPELIARLELNGMVMLPLLQEVQKEQLLPEKACQQYALNEYTSNLIVLDTGHAKLMTPYFPLEKLRLLPGFENAHFFDPYAGGIGNSIRFGSIIPCDNGLKVAGIENLFCAGEKTGLLVGHTEAIATGFLAGHNTARYLARKEALIIPSSLATGDLISYMHQEMQTPAGLRKKYTFSGSVYFQRMQELGLYTIDVNAIKERVASHGLIGVFSKKVL